MNNRPPIASPSGPPLPSPPPVFKIDLPALVKAQKWVLWCVLANFLSVVLTLITRDTLASTTGGVRLLALFQVLRLGIAVLTAVSVWNLARSLRTNFAWLVALVSLIPGAGFIALLVLNSRATTKLQQEGYIVGLMGAKRRNG